MSSRDFMGLLERRSQKTEELWSVLESVSEKLRQTTVADSEREMWKVRRVALQGCSHPPRPAHAFLGVAEAGEVWAPRCATTPPLPLISACLSPAALRAIPRLIGLPTLCCHQAKLDELDRSQAEVASLRKEVDRKSVV